MPSSPADLFAALDRLGIAHRTISHAPAFTVTDAQALRGILPGGHTKNLFLKDKKGALFLIVALEDTEIRLNALHQRLGCARLSFGAPDLLMATLGVPPGSVTPFAAVNDSDQRVTIVLDREMMAHDDLNFHPLDNRMTTTICREGLLRFLQSTGHRPVVMDLRAEGGDESSAGAIENGGSANI